MNKRQKLVQQQFLDNEEAVIRKLKNNYHHALNDINRKIEQLMSRQDADMQHVIYQVEYQKALKKQIEGILDTMQTEQFDSVAEYITKCYEEGFIGTMYDLHGQGIPLCFPIDQEAITRAVQLDSKLSQGLYTRLGEDVAVMKKKVAAQVSRGISTGMTFSEVANQLERIANIGYNNAIRIARTEGHRVQAQSAMDACAKAAERGADVLKQWDGTLDRRTRPSHRKVDGELRELDEPFSNGLMFPGDPDGKAKEVINCRCALLQRARWALDEAELETLKERAKYFGLDKSENFKDFKEKYLKASENDVLLTREEIRQRITDDKKRISDINSDIRSIDRDIEKHDNAEFDDLKGLKKSDISDRIKEIEARNAEIDPIISRLYDRPERGTPEYEEWREWKRSIDRFALTEEQMQLATEKASLESQMRKWGRYEEWMQWKRDNPLDVLQARKNSLRDEIGQIEAGIKKYKDQLSNMAIPKDWKQIVGAHDSEFDIKAANPRFSEGGKWRVNCQRCVPTYEMRRRGYDVVAKPKIMDGKDETASRWSEIFDDEEWIECSSGSGVKQIQSKMKEWGDGARAEIYVAWKGGEAHVFVAEQVGGKTVFIDPQTGSMDCKDYFKYVRSGTTSICRIDNLRPSNLIADCCERRE